MRPVSPESVVPPPLAVSRMPRTTTVSAGTTRPSPGARAPAARACQAPAAVPAAAPRKLETTTSASSASENGSSAEPASPNTIRTSAQTTAAATVARSPSRAVMPTSAGVGVRVVVRREIEVVLVRVLEAVAPEQEPAHDEDDHQHHERHECGD